LLDKGVAETGKHTPRVSGKEEILGAKAHSMNNEENG